MRIIFLHGKESTPETSRTAVAIVKRFSDIYKVEVLDYHPSERTFNELYRYFSDFEFREDDCVIGISLGGYWAAMVPDLSNGIVKRIILLNPALSYYSNYLPWKMAGVCGHFIYCGDDPIVNNQAHIPWATNYLKITEYKKGGHRMTTILPKVLDDIENTLEDMESMITP